MREWMGGRVHTQTGRRRNRQPGERRSLVTGRKNELEGGGERDREMRKVMAGETQAVERGGAWKGRERIER